MLACSFRRDLRPAVVQVYSYYNKNQSLVVLASVSIDNPVMSCYYV